MDVGEELKKGEKMQWHNLLYPADMVPSDGKSACCTTAQRER